MFLGGSSSKLESQAPETEMTVVVVAGVGVDVALQKVAQYVYGERESSCSAAATE